jgi:hypothetical protein
MSQREVAITGGPSNTKAMVTGQEELLVKVNSLTLTGSNLDAKTRTSNILRTTTTGTIAAGAYSVSFANTNTVNATVKTVILKPGETINFDAGAMNNTLDAIPYVATGTELLIISIT